VITATGQYYFTFSITGHGETITLFDGEMMCTETYNAEEVRWDPLMSSGIDQYAAKRGFWSVELAVGLAEEGCFGELVPDYEDGQVSSKVIRIIQSYTEIINQKIWRKG